MRDKRFKADYWLKASGAGSDGQIIKKVDHAPHSIKRAMTSKIPDNIRLALEPFIPQTKSLNDKGLKKYFIPGWQGSALISKEAKSFLLILNTVHQDCLANFKNLQDSTRKYKIAIFDEFLAFAEFCNLNCESLDNYIDFWKEINHEQSEHKEVIKSFINIYCFRVSVLYILKARFVCSLIRNTNDSFKLKHLLYPNSYITSKFPQGSQYELKSNLLKPNAYSWYLPKKNLETSLSKLFNLTESLNVTDIIKNISIKSEEILGRKAYYSHALSQKNFGLFLNSLILNFPLWKNTKSDSYQFTKLPSTKDIEVISTKFNGDFLESMALSHWLGQEANQEAKWDQIICPSFQEENFETGEYLQLINETQFLTFLIELANKQGHSPINFISSVMSDHAHNSSIGASAQEAFLFHDDQSTSKSFDRLVLNLNIYPKNNPQHYMIHKVIKESAELKDDGYIFLVSNKKLFVKSIKDKINNLLQDLKVEAIITLDEVEGKGEVGSYIYIFSKRKGIRLEKDRESVLHFRFQANLESFAKFSNLTGLLSTFFLNNIGETTPAFYHKMFNNVKLEAFQDAIFDGRLIHSTSKDLTKITHPIFFQKLINTCQPLDFFFEIKPLNLNRQSESDEAPLLEHTENQVDFCSEYILIIDQRLKNQTKLQIIPTNFLDAISYEYGFARCTYFKIFSKWPSINFDAICDFYSTSIGQQIIDLTFASEPRNVKNNLPQLLLPKFYSQEASMPIHIKKGINFLNFDKDAILELHPSKIKDHYSEIINLCKSLSAKYPLDVFSSLSKMKSTLNKCLSQLESPHQVINFNNPSIKAPLLLTKTFPIYPENPDIFIDFTHEDSIELMKYQLEDIKTKKNKESHEESFILELYTQSTLVLRLISDEEMINFIKFLLANLKGVNLIDILQGIQVPKLDDLKAIIKSYNSMQRTISEISKDISDDINQLIINKISHN